MHPAFCVEPGRRWGWSGTAGPFLPLSKSGARCFGRVTGDKTALMVDPAFKELSDR